MDQNIFEWMLIIVRWVHITVGICWIGTSIFFMWLDRSFKKIQDAPEGHLGQLWMVHGGGFYRVDKLEMGPTKVPSELHWFKWESYWTFITGITLVGMIFYTGEGTFLLDSEVSTISYHQGVAIGVFSMLGSWFFYDFLWERKICATHPKIGHLLTLIWLAGMSYFLCHTLSGRAAYIHIAGMIGVWMTANVFVRIIPRQVKMVEASKANLPVNQDWGKNAKNRSTHNTYFTLPILFLMISNHFPSTYGHEYNWLIVLLICVAGACIRQFFVARVSNPKSAKIFAFSGILMLLSIIIGTGADLSTHTSTTQNVPPHESHKVETTYDSRNLTTGNIKGVIHFIGTPPKGKKLSLPTACAQQFSGEVYSNEVMVKDGKLKNVLVRIIKGHEGMSFPNIPENEVEIDQIGCIYRPRVVAARVGQKVTYINSDPIFHNIRLFAKNNKKFNKSMPNKDQRITRVFKYEEEAFQTKCSVHPWMGVFISVYHHPFFDVSDEKGEFQIKNLPVGRYTLKITHEVYGDQMAEIIVKENEDLSLNFTFNQ